MHPLMLTVEHEKGELNESTFEVEPPHGYAVIKLNGREVKKIKLVYFHESEGREDLEEAAASWLAGERVRDQEEAP
jgi:hypothetical protein